MSSTCTYLPAEPLLVEELVVERASPWSVAAARRRRARVLGVLLVLVVALAWWATRAGAALGDVPASVPERRPGPVVHVVQPGDTLWSIARDLQPEGDIRPLVRQLVEANGGATLDVGDRVVLP